ncbi:MAG: pepF3 [Bacillales bacterium]|jgi:oligoendopeptidase F|nr:pepF3 [Bacillales bacterium]
MSQTGVKKLPKRNEISEELKWNLEAIYNNIEAWDNDFKVISERAEEITSFEGKLATGADTFYSMLKLQDEVMMQIGKLYTYAHMRHDEDTTNSTYKALYDRAISLYSQVSSKFAYIVPEILTIPEDIINGYFDQEPELRLYKHAIEEINRQRPHVLSSKEEALLASASEVLSSPGMIFGSLNNSDMKFPTIIDDDGEEVEITHGRYSKFLESANQRVRRDAFKGVYDTYGKFVNTLASTLSASTKKNVFNAKARNYTSARAAALAQNKIPEEVYDQLIKTVTDNLHLLHRYIELRKRVLNLDELHIYDLYTPLVKEVKMEVKYEEAQELLLNGFKVLGEDYIEVLKDAYKNRWVDVVENEGKRSGAYSSGTYATNPYILMNWQNNVNNLFTLAHEFGHSMHSYYTRKNQPFIYGDYSIFVAEVASTCNEALLNDYLLKTTEDPRKRLYLVNHYLEAFRGTVFRQTMFAEFEHLIHQKIENGEALTPQLLNKEYYDLNIKYFGKENMVIDDEIKLEWSRIPHFYYNYYVYQYATGFSAATALSKQILEEGEPAVKRYLEFLKSGSSDYPINVLKKAGVDMTSPEPIQAALKTFEEMLQEMENLIDTI